MNKENPKNPWALAQQQTKYISKERPPYIAPSDVEKAGDDLVWAIEAVIEDPMSLKRWFLVKDAIARYKAVRKES